MSTAQHAPHPAETKHEVNGPIRTCLPALGDQHEAATAGEAPDPEWNVVRGED